MKLKRGPLILLYAHYIVYCVNVFLIYHVLVDLRDSFSACIILRLYVSLHFVKKKSADWTFPTFPSRAHAKRGSVSVTFNT